MTNTTWNCQVLVVGAGPTGLVLAAELLARGVTTRIIDKSDGVVLESRALGIHARTLEVFDLMGLADRFLERGHIVRRMRMYADGRPLISLDLSRIESRYPFLLDIPQNETETLLRDRIAELGGQIEQNVELLTLVQDESRVLATVRDAAGQESEIRADYAVGCDGAHSRVRREVGLPFDGHGYAQDWLLADVQLDWCRPEEESHALFRSDGRPMICFPMRDHYWRVVFPYTGERDRGAPTFEEIQQLIDSRAPERVVASNPTWLANFRCSRRSTTAYRRGRVMLAGDAVHIHSPAGGQGMNTGITDAHNLAWKLALVARRRASDGVLDSYGEERRPVAAQVLEWTHNLVRLGTVSHPIKRALRDSIVPLASRVPEVQRRAVRRMSQQHVEYRASPLTSRGSLLARLRPGDRAPEITVLALNGSARLQEVLRGGRHVLVVASRSQADLLERPDMQSFRDWCEVVVGRFARDGRTDVWLIRPDGYLAATGTAESLAYLKRVFTGIGFANAALSRGPVARAVQPGSSGVPTRSEP
ncbi:MAG: FAD-dependent monooxygenase [Chloroflexi bacterium]|nr:FAD-dependent monooxygenase [Chloroflexota bacterium]